MCVLRFFKDCAFDWKKAALCTLILRWVLLRTAILMSEWFEVWDEVQVLLVSDGHVVLLKEDAVLSCSV